MQPNNFPRVVMSIPTFDRRSDKPLPLPNKPFRLDWSQLSEEEQSDAIAILSSRAPSHSPIGFDEVVVTVSLTGSAGRPSLIKYRRAFVAIQPGEYSAWLLGQDERRGGGTQIMQAPDGYVEDELGNPTTSAAVFQHLNGGTPVVIYGDPKSALQFGPTSPAHPESWTVEAANTIGQFLDVMTLISQSEWLQHPHSMTTVERKQSGSEMVEANIPSASQTLSVLSYLRQLHAQDRLFVNACEAYLKQAGDEIRKELIESYKSSFKTMIGEPPVEFIVKTEFTRQKLIRMFMYGARLLHSESNDGSDKDFEKLVQAHGTQKVVTLINSCLIDIYNGAATSYAIIKQDFDYWVNECGLIGPSRICIPDLFTCFTSPPRGS